MIFTAFLFSALSLFAAQPPNTWIIRGAQIVDGTGGPITSGDVRVEGDRIAEVGRLKPLPGEVVVTHKDGFYSCEAKYLDPDGAVTKIPADLSPELTDRVRRLSVEAFRALDLCGMARVDFLLDDRGGGLYVNEVNTIPGFTAISMFPKMWEATGLAYPDLLDTLVTLALERHERKQRLRTSRT